MKKVFYSVLLFSCLLFAGSLFASVDPVKAHKIASNFALEKGNLSTKALSEITLFYTEYEGNEPLYYIFDVAGSGFVVVSACEITKPVLAYSFEFPYKNNPALENWMGSYRKDILKHKAANTPVPAKNKAQWDHFSQANFTPNPIKTGSVGPLLTTTWNQNKYYNTYCPWDVHSGSYYDYRVPNGCVALACAMIMNYYRHPETGVGGASYVPEPYPRQTVRFFDHIYHWDAMTDEAEWYNGEVAKIIYHMGVACQMGYNPEGSGSYTELAASKMAAHFGYKQNFEKIYPGNYTNGYEHVYVEMLKEELDYLRPVLYSGQAPGGGHAFVCDGYDNDDYFHFNWGWGGSGNGYFLYDNITYNTSAMGITHLYPANNYPVQCTDYKRQTASVGYITNGSTNYPYASNPDCQWMIATPGANHYEFSFSRLDVAPTDVVTIYNGPTQNAGVAGQFTGNTIPADVEVDADSVLITFTATTPSPNDSHRGFLINYSTNPQPRDCAANTTLTGSIFGRISDEAPEGENYIPETSCSWLIAPLWVTGYSFTFPQFDIGLGDFIDFYDATTTPPTFWKRFDLNNIPEDMIHNFPFSKLKVTFVSDNFIQDEGFMIDYYAIVGIEENSGLSNLNYSPNPASDFVNITFETPEVQNIVCKIIDVNGRVVLTQSFNHNGGAFTETLNVSSLASGIYILNVETNSGKAGGKIIIQ